MFVRTLVFQAHTVIIPKLIVYVTMKPFYTFLDICYLEISLTLLKQMKTRRAADVHRFVVVNLILSTLI